MGYNVLREGREQYRPTEDARASGRCRPSRRLSCRWRAAYLELDETIRCLWGSRFLSASRCCCLGRIHEQDSYNLPTTSKPTTGMNSYDPREVLIDNPSTCNKANLDEEGSDQTRPPPNQLGAAVPSFRLQHNQTGRKLIQKHFGIRPHGPPGSFDRSGVLETLQHPNSGSRERARVVRHCS